MDTDWKYILEIISHNWPTRGITLQISLLYLFKWEKCAYYSNLILTKVESVLSLKDYADVIYQGLPTSLQEGPSNAGDDEVVCLCTLCRAATGSISFSFSCVLVILPNWYVTHT